MKIKVKCFNGLPLPMIIRKGEWIDLTTAEDVTLQGPYANVLTSGRTKRDVVIEQQLIPLSVAMELPKGYEAHVLARSSTSARFSIIQANSMGIIDSTYCGDNDQWGFKAIPLADVFIPKGSRIAQFRITLSQFATPWQKLKWLFTSKIELVQVDHLGNPNRGGFGSTNK